jgi:RsiW-degrading membrane proteinase PrsW (M82 family)
LAIFFLTLALCAGFTALLVYRYDLHDHEPVPLLVVAVALGAGMMRLAGRVEASALSRMGHVSLYDVAALAAFTEEGLKLLVVVAVALLARREFDDPMDGVVYGSMAGLGAALEESVFYAGLSPAKPIVMPAAELVRLWAHVVLGGIVGFPLGFWRARPVRAAWAALVALAVAFALHLAWDAVVLSVPDGVAPSVSQTLVGLTVMVASLVLYGKLVATASARSREQFAAGSPLRLWRWPFAGGSS